MSQISASTQIKNKNTNREIGDDAAILDPGNKKMVVSRDKHTKGVHFDLSYFVSLKHYGYKVVVTNLSDIYTMNAHPMQITFGPP